MLLVWWPGNQWPRRWGNGSEAIRGFDKPASRWRAYIIQPDIFSRSLEVRAYQSCQQLAYASLGKSTWPCSEILLNPMPTASWKLTVFKNPVICKYLKAEDRALDETRCWYSCGKESLSTTFGCVQMWQIFCHYIQRFLLCLETMILFIIYRSSNVPCFLTHVFSYSLSWCFYETHPSLTLARIIQISWEWRAFRNDYF